MKERTNPNNDEKNAARERYLWFLRTPFKGKFDGEHWWNTDHSNADLQSALYELVRRHPDVGAAHANNSTLVSNPAIGCIRRFGLKSWMKLTDQEKESWRLNGAILKGVDCRYEFEQCNSPTLQGKSNIGLVRLLDRNDESLKTAYETNNLSLAGDLISQELDDNPPTSEEIASAVMAEALDAHQEGHMLFNIAPGLSPDLAAQLFGERYRTWLKNSSGVSSQRRARWQNWLDLIVLLRRLGTRESQEYDFVRYRRVMDTVFF